MRTTHLFAVIAPLLAALVSAEYAFFTITSLTSIEFPDMPGYLDHYILVNATYTTAGDTSPEGACSTIWSTSDAAKQGSEPDNSPPMLCSFHDSVQCSTGDHPLQAQVLNYKDQLTFDINLEFNCTEVVKGCVHIDNGRADFNVGPPDQYGTVNATAAKQITFPVGAAC